MQGRGTTHRGNRLLRATAWLQHPPRPAIRKEAGRSSQAVNPFREASICTNTCCSMTLRSGTAPPSPAVGRLRKLCPRSAVHPGVNPSIWHHSNESAPVHYTAPRNAYTPEGDFCLSATSPSSARAAFPYNQCPVSPRKRCRRHRSPPPSSRPIAATLQLRWHAGLTKSSKQ